jgi:hypothetical protein
VARCSSFVVAGGMYMESLEPLLKDPMVWGSILVMPVVIIALAVSWKKLKQKDQAKKASAE